MRSFNIFCIYKTFCSSHHPESNGAKILTLEKSYRNRSFARYAPNRERFTNIFKCNHANGLSMLYLYREHFSVETISSFQMIHVYIPRDLMPLIFKFPSEILNFLQHNFHCFDYCFIKKRLFENGYWHFFGSIIIEGSSTMENDSVC